jgi:ADP-ribose pyrophosphatase
MEKFKRLRHQDIYQGNRVHLVTEQLLSPDGKEVTWELIKHIGAAAVIPVDNNGDILMVKQYRLASDSITLEIPAGVLDEKHEDPKECALRELEEETGFQCQHMDFLFKFYSSIGICDEVIHIFVAKDLIKTKQNLDDDEFVEIKSYPLDQLIHMIFNGELLDNKTISALLAYKYQLERGNN